MESFDFLPCLCFPCSAAGGLVDGGVESYDAAHCAEFSNDALACRAVSRVYTHAIDHDGNGIRSRNLVKLEWDQKRPYRVDCPSSCEQYKKGIRSEYSTLGRVAQGQWNHSCYFRGKAPEIFTFCAISC